MRSTRQLLPLCLHDDGDADATGGIPAGGGMQVGPGHPYFMDRLRHPELQPGMGGLRPPPPGLGGGGLQPPVPGLPPGARWDPIAPEGLQGWQPDDFTRPR